MKDGASFAMPLSQAEIERAIASAREALMTFGEHVTMGTADSADIYSRARLQADVLTTLLDNVSDAQTEEIEYLLDRYDVLLASLLN